MTDLGEATAAVQNTVGVEVRNLTKIFGPNPERCLKLVEQGVDKSELRDRHDHTLGLHDVSIKMLPGNIQVIMGLSGSGKSTLLRHINRLIVPTSGQILAGAEGDQVDVTAMSVKELREFRQTKTAMVFQKFALFPHLTVQENTEYGLKIRGVDAKVRAEGASRWIERVGLKGYEDSFPKQLSGGMQQRVGLARALTNDAPILLMDEAFSALDPLIRTDMQSVLLDIQQEVDKTIVFITHDLDEALRIGDQVAILRAGRVVQQGSGEEIVLNPADEYITSFISDVNRGRVIHCRLIAKPGNAVDGPNVKSSLLLEEAARVLNADTASRANVIDPNGSHIGVITMADIVAAMLPANT